MPTRDSLVWDLNRPADPTEQFPQSAGDIR